MGELPKRVDSADAPIIERQKPNLEETWFDGYFTVTRRGDPIPWWWRWWAKVFFNYKWKRI